MTKIYFLLSALLFANIVQAQPPVRDAPHDDARHDKVVAELEEPHHKLLLENEYMRLIDGYVPGHDTTLTHIHAANSVVIFLSKSKVGIRNVGGAPVVTDVSPGDAVYRAYGDKPVTHIVWNEDKSMFHFMVVELKRPHPDKDPGHPGNDSSAILSRPGLKFQWQQPLVRAYYLDIDKGKRYMLPKSNYAYLLIGVYTNDFVFFPPQKDIEINAGKDGNTHCVLLELK